MKDKEIVFVIEYRVTAEESHGIAEGLDKLRETGEAEIVDVRVEPRKKHK